MPFDDSRHERSRQPLTPTIGTNDDPTDDAACVPVRRFRVDQHAEIGGRSGIIRYEEVLRLRFLVTIIELFLIDPLLDKEDVGSQLQKRIEFGWCGRPGGLTSAAGATTDR